MECFGICLLKLGQFDNAFFCFEKALKLYPSNKRDEKKYHITRIGIFGSVIRDEAGPGSDKDILVDFSDDAGLLDHSSLKIYLEKHKKRIGMGLLFLMIPGSMKTMNIRLLI